MLGGDLRQILPVIEGGTRSQIIDARIMHSPIWCCVTVLHLMINMRLANHTTQIDRQHNVSLFSQWLLDLGDGRLPAIAREGEHDSTWIKILVDLLIRTNGDKIDAIVSTIYIGILHHATETLHICTNELS